MKVLISIEVMKAGWGWDDKAVKKDITIDADEIGTLIPAVVGAIKGIELTIISAVSERQALLLKEEIDDDN